ncbi:MAG: tetratricopeptide repeat protein [bacterium]|nr:tetratricopeptide repeat protein [bacterium]
MYLQQVVGYQPVSRPSNSKLKIRRPARPSRPGSGCPELKTRNSPSAIRNPQSAIRNRNNPQSAISCLVFTFILILFLPATAEAIGAKGHYQTGEQYRQEGKYPQAIEAYQQAIRLNPYYKEAYNGLGQAYSSSEMYKEALLAFARAITIDPKYLAAHINLGFTYEVQGDLEKAGTEYKLVLELEPSSADGHFYLAGLARKLRDVNQAIKEYKTAIKIDPEYVWAYINLGSIYWEEPSVKDIDRAAAYYKEAKVHDERNEWVYLNLASLYDQQGRPKRAEAEFEDALRLAPDNPQILKASATFFLKRGKYDRAIILYEALAKLVPYNSLTHYASGLSYKGAERNLEAREEFLNALELKPYDEIALAELEDVILMEDDVLTPIRNKYSDYHLELAEHYFNENKIPWTVFHRRKAVKLNPQSGKARLELAKVYDHQGMLDSAIEELKKAMELKPQNTEASDLLERVYRTKEGLSSTREEIALTKLPPPEMRLVVLRFRPEEFLHPEIDRVFRKLLISVLEEYPHLKVVALNQTDTNEIELGSPALPHLRSYFSATHLLQGSFKEEDEIFSLKAQLVRLDTLDDTPQFEIKTKGNNRIFEAAGKLAEKIIETIPPAGRIVKVKKSGDCYINLGRNHGLKLGQILDVYEEGMILTDPTTGKPSGTKERIFGQIKITELEARLAKAQIITPALTRFIQVNQRVRPVPPAAKQ